MAGNDGALATERYDARQTFESVRIRPYSPPDRPRICELCCETGFLGDPVDALFQDRELFADLFTKAYLDHEPEWSLTAEADGRVIGYLLGSVCPGFDRAQLRAGFRTTARMLLRLASGRYSGHERSRRFIRWLLLAGLWEQPKHPRDAAHLHLNIDKEYRGRGIVRELWRHFERRLNDRRARRCYGAFFSHPGRRPELAYARYGFTVYDRRRTSLFAPEISHAVEVVCVAKEL